MYKSDSGGVGGLNAANIEDLIVHGHVVTSIGLMETSQHLDERRFARAVLTDECVNFALFHVKSGILEGNLARKSL